MYEYVSFCFFLLFLLKNIRVNYDYMMLMYVLRSVSLSEFLLYQLIGGVNPGSKNKGKYKFIKFTIYNLIYFFL